MIELWDDFMNNYRERLGTLLYLNYKFNRKRSPDIPPEDWVKVFGEKAREMETLFKLERSIE